MVYSVEALALLTVLWVSPLYRCDGGGCPQIYSLQSILESTHVHSDKPKSEGFEYHRDSEYGQGGNILNFLNSI